MPSLCAMLRRSGIEWGRVDDAEAPLDAVHISFYLENPLRYQSKDEIMVALSESIQVGDLPWLSLQSGKWILDFDVLQARFSPFHAISPLHDYDSLTGARQVRPLFKQRSIRDAGRDLHYNHLEFIVPLDEQPAPGVARELEQKFGILFSARQAGKDFHEWTDGGAMCAMPVTFLFVDIDNFKVLNTRYTETRVDVSVLPEVQRLLERLVRYRGYAYRHGGEEFLVLLPNWPSPDALAFAERLRRAVCENDFSIEEDFARITVSVGVAFFPDHGTTFENVLLAANVAKQQAKDGGRNRVVVATVNQAA